MTVKEEKLVIELRELVKDVPTERLVFLLNCYIIPANILLIVEYQYGDVRKELT